MVHSLHPRWTQTQQTLEGFLWTLQTLESKTSKTPAFRNADWESHASTQAKPHSTKTKAPWTYLPGRHTQATVHFSAQWLHWFGVQQLGSLIFHLPWESDFPPPSSSLLNRRGTRAGGKPLKLLMKIHCILCSRKRNFIYYCSVQYVWFIKA